MKNLYTKILALFALVAIVFAGCSLAAPSSGHLSITVPTDASSRNVDPRDAAGGEYARVYVVLNGSYIKLGSNTDYLERNPGSSSSISIDLPAGSGYKAYAVLGTKEGGLWSPTWYGSSDSFTVSAGVYTEKTIKVAERPGTYYASSGATGSLSINGTVWRLTGSKVYEASLGTPVEIPGTVYSLTEGLWFDGADKFAKEPWINTSEGIYTIKSGILTKRASITATYSGAISASGDNPGDKQKLVMVYYGSDIGFASSDDASKESVDDSWSSGGLNKFLGTDDGKSFKDLLSDVKSLIKDYALIIDGGKTYGFVATSLGTYLYNDTMRTAMGTSKDDILEWVKGQIEKSSYAVALYDSAGKSAQITSLAFDSDSDATVKYVYAGSGIGLFSASAAGLSVATSAPILTRVDGITANVVKVAASGSYVAYADSEGTVRLLNNGAQVSSYPFYAYTSTKNGLSDLSFYTDSSVVHLTISSGDGLLDISIQ